ncbi:hypothetical protein PVAG01_08392 [Phlyctema vagabunda]|uniref:FAD-binding PCMH-type domain-containing protein n=1 Tax=Phlyctema vagabunda TaxID=108571 RepID=A0ABR4P9A2_9HELO
MYQPANVLLTGFFLGAAVLSNPSDYEGLEARYQDLAACLTAKKVPTSLDTSSNWTSLITPFNLRLPYTPAAVTLPSTYQHISDSVTCAATAGIKVQARSGGHGYGNYAIGGKDGSVFLDLQKFNSIELDTSTNVAAVGGGVRLGNLGVGIYNQGKRCLPHGTYPGVGIGGHYTHGGFGFASRRYGLALDTIVALDVVLANGSCIHATPTSYPDIYFALRGAADSFGIVTTFHLQTQPAPDSLVSWSASFASALSSVEKAAEVILRLQSFAQTSTLMDRNLTVEAYVDIYGNYTLSGWYFGAEDLFNGTILPALIQGMPTPDSVTIQSLGWIEALKSIAQGASLTMPTSGYDAHQTFYAKSLVTRESKPLTKAAVTSVFEYLIEKGLTSSYPWNVFFDLYGGIDSQINVPSVDSSAYAHRDSLFTIQMVASTADSLPPWSASITSLVAGISTSIADAQPDGDFLSYPNYLDTEYTATEAANLYCGASVYEKLAAIKSVVDPKSLFWNPQAVGNAKL